MSAIFVLWEIQSQQHTQESYKNRNSEKSRSYDINKCKGLVNIHIHMHT